MIYLGCVVKTISLQHLLLHHHPSRPKGLHHMASWNPFFQMYSHTVSWLFYVLPTTDHLKNSMKSENINQRNIPMWQASTIKTWTTSSSWFSVVDIMFYAPLQSACYLTHLHFHIFTFQLDTRLASLSLRHQCCWEWSNWSNGRTSNFLSLQNDEHCKFL